MSPEAGLAHPGTLIAIVGASGAGKDTLIAYARERLGAEPSILFVRRVVTRTAQPDAEDHDTLSAEAFADAHAAGRFATIWEAHGLRYAIPIEALRHVAGGGAAVVNGSRAALPAIRSAFGQVLTVHVTCRPDVLAARLAARGRESIEQQGQRLARAAMPSDGLQDAVEIDNSDDMTTAGDALVGVICNAVGLSGRCTASRAPL